MNKWNQNLEKNIFSFLSNCKDYAAIYFIYCCKLRKYKISFKCICLNLKNMHNLLKTKCCNFLL